MRSSVYDPSLPVHATVPAGLAPGTVLPRARRRRLGVVGLVTLIGVALGLVPIPARVAQAATFTIADGDVAGLIAAINASNASPGADTIELAAGGTYTLTAVDNDGWWGPTGLPVVATQITIDGNGARIERSAAPGTPDFRVLLNVGTLVLLDMAIAGGSTGAGGGALANGGGGTVELRDSLITGNTAAHGGGLQNYCGTLRVINSTISHNVGTGGYGGGGILQISSYCVSTTLVVGSTISENRNTWGRGDAIADAFSAPGNFILKNSVVASLMEGLGSDCYMAPGALASRGHNIASDASCSLAGVGDMNGTDPLLGPLADNGGPTWTHAPLVGSPAINGVPLVDCTDAVGAALGSDQRGVVRPQGAACDVGAVELVLNRPPTADAGVDQTVEATGPLGASVILDGSGSSDPDGDGLSFDWTGPFGLASGVNLTVVLGFGPNVVTLTVGDGTETDSDTVEVTVVYPWSHFLQPVDGSGWNSAKAGRAIPVKFDLGGDMGLDVLLAGFPKVTAISCPGSTVVPDPIEESATTAGGSSLSYDADSGGYVYVWKSQTTYAGKCYLFSLGLRDGTTHTFRVEFTK